MLLLAYLVLAVTVLNKPDESEKTCREIRVNIADKNTNGFLDVNEIKTMLLKQDKWPYLQQMDKIEPRTIEELLMSSPFINTAQCYKSKDSLVSIEVTQRLPVIRIKGDDGGDYYLDDKGGVVPNASYNSDLIIATGKFSKKFAMSSLALLAQTITDDEFWNAQIEQINVLATGGIELVPRVGEHIVYIGTLPQAEDSKEQKTLIEDYVKERLHRLELFYRYGLSKAGWNKYGYINLEFDNQIICKKDKNSMEEPDLEQQKKEEEDAAASADGIGGPITATVGKTETPRAKKP
ncbi:MAG: cell division protein FtsQ [Bacteroidaceae bacterium]|nr:cell division protein FtsQ [Bacteroidaceae bacterium]